MSYLHLFFFLISPLGSFQTQAGEESDLDFLSDFSTHLNATEPTVAVGRSVWTGRERSSLCRGSITTLRQDEATVLKSHLGHGWDPYPDNYQCRWLVIPDGCEIDLHCSVGTNVNSTDDCTRSDYLRILGYRGAHDSFHCGSKGLNLTFVGDDAVAVVFRATKRIDGDNGNKLSDEETSLHLQGFSCRIVCRKVRLSTTTQESTKSSNEVVPSVETTTLSTQFTELKCKCGESRSARVVCPVGANCTAGLGAVPWQAAIVSTHHSQPWCGGTIISDQYVLTAAHCLQNKAADRVQVVLGDNDWTTGEEAHELRYDVLEIKMHPSFGKAAQFDFDFALIKISRPIQFSSSVRPACLPQEQEGGDFEDDNQLVGKAAEVSGWGVTDPRSPQRQARKLQRISVQIMSKADCSARYSGGAVTSSMMCASAIDGDACFGDSGGPMTVKAGSVGPSVLEGVISWGKSCAKEDWPGVYSRVRGVLGWIRNNTRDSSFCMQKLVENRSNQEAHDSFVFPL